MNQDGLNHIPVTIQITFLNFSHVSTKGLIIITIAQSGRALTHSALDHIKMRSDTIILD